MTAIAAMVALSSATGNGTTAGAKGGGALINLAHKNGCHTGNPLLNLTGQKQLYENHKTGSGVDVHRVHTVPVFYAPDVTNIVMLVVIHPDLQSESWQQDILGLPI